MKTRSRLLLLALMICTLLCAAAMTVGAESTSTPEARESFFGELFTAVRSHSSELMSALAFFGSLVIALSYRNGFVPTLKNGMGSIGSAISEVKSTSASLKEAQSALGDRIQQRIEKIENSFSSITALLEKSLSELEKLDTGAAEQEKFKAIIGEQVSLLYDVFMFSSIPEYQKDAVGHRVEKMRRLISGEEASENEEAIAE